MQLPTANSSGIGIGIGSKPSSSVTPTTTTYTTIPISGYDVISRSAHNFSAFLYLRRPWPEFLAAGVFDRPETLTCALDRLSKNAKYFRLNYGLLLFTSGFLSLLGTPLSLLFVCAIFGLWLVLYIFREDPLYLWGHHLTDRMVLVGLISVSVVTLWVTGIVQNLILGVGIGLVVSAIHAVLRNPDGLFLNEDDAASTGLIGSASHSVQR